MPKKAIILRHNGGELGNQLWNAISIYAFCLDKGYKFSNWTFFEYEKLFIRTENVPRLIRVAFYAPASLFPRLTKKIYAVFAKFILYFLEKNILRSGNSPFIEGPCYLPPTKSLITSQDKDLYFDGWLFRNPIGLTTYRKEILERFAFKKNLMEKPQALIDELRKTSKKIVGIHIRLGDYRTFKNGKYFIKPARFKEIAIQYLQEKGLSAEDTAFILCANEPVAQKTFKGLNARQTGFSGAEDLYTLSLCDAIIGSDSSFSAFAAYLGDIPHIIASKDPIDWSYYKDKKGFFFGKYSTVVGF